MTLPVELRQLLDDNGTGRHVDPERERLGREHRLHESFDEARLDRLLERRHHSGVVGREAVLEGSQEPVVPEHIEIVITKRANLVFDDGGDVASLLRQREPKAAGEARRDGVVTRSTAEDEVDGREHVVLLEGIDDFDPPRRRNCPAPVRPHLQRVLGLPVELRRVRVGTAAHERRQHRHVAAVAICDHVQVDELDRALLVDDRLGVPPHRGDPRGELFSVGDCGREADEVNVEGRVDDHLLPHRAAIGVLQVVHLVEHDVAQPLQCARPGVDHVAQHLGRHHDDRRALVHGVVAGEQPDPVAAVAGHEVGELLIRERLDRCRVERLAALGERLVDGVLGHHRLARSGRCGNDDRRVPVDRVEGADLEVVESERERGDERPAGGGHLFRLASHPMPMEAK